MAGIDDAERDPNRIRARAIARDIYARHGIPEGTPADQASLMVLMKAQEAGLADDQLRSTSAWRNPDERAAAREEYARRGKTPQEVKERWEKSIYLMDPQTSGFYQNYMRDADFLEMAARERELGGSMPPQSQAAADPTGMGDWRDIAKGMQAGRAKAALDDALYFWDQSNGTPLYRDSLVRGNFASASGLGGGVVNATSNPDVWFGNYSNFSEVIPDALRMQGSGESSNFDESMQAAQGRRLALNRYRPTSPSMIADVPSGATQDDLGRRVAALRQELQAAELPTPDVRWKQWTKENFGKEWAPHPAVSSGLDFAFSQADPTVFLPLAAGAKSLASHGIRGLRALAADMGKDQAIEQAIGHAALQSVGGAQPGEAKSPSEIAAAKSARKAIYDRTANDGAIKSADDAAWLRLQKDGLVSPWVR